MRNISVESVVKLENESFQKSCTSTSQNPENRITKSIYMKLNVKTIERLKQIKGEKEWDELLNDILDVMEVTSEIRCEAIPEPVNTGKRYIPAKIKKYVIAKTSGLCAYPGCSKPYEILHHTTRFGIDSTHHPDTLVPLCKAHERLAHTGLIEGEESTVANWGIKLNEDTKNAKHKIDQKVNQHYQVWRKLRV